MASRNHNKANKKRLRKRKRAQSVEKSVAVIRLKLRDISGVRRIFPFHEVKKDGSE